jgi:hypothetical protein
MTGALETFKMGICAAWTLLGKSFASSISPWIVTMDALEPFRVLAQNKIQVHYLMQQKDSFDIHLEAAIQPEMQNLLL